MSTDSWQWLADLGASQWEKGVGARQTRWDVITACNLEKIYRAAHSQDEKPPLVPSPHSHQAPLLLKREALRTNSAWLVSPEALVLRPSQISNRPGALFAPQGVAQQPDSPALYGTRRSQPHNSPEILLRGKEAPHSLCFGFALYQSACLTQSHMALSPPSTLYFIHPQQRGELFRAGYASKGTMIFIDIQATIGRHWKSICWNICQFIL